MKASAAFPLVIAAPSGAGKTSLAQELVRRHEDVVFSISATTRPPRNGERDGEHYHFVADAEFSRMVENGELLEWACVHDHRYGTLHREVARGLERDCKVVLDIDVQGARQVRERLHDAVLVFVLPPSAEELVRRLEGRATDSAAQRALRMRNAAEELAALDEFDYVVVNDDFEAAVAALESIISAESRRIARVTGLQDVVAGMAGTLQHIVQRSQ